MIKKLLKVNPLIGPVVVASIAAASVIAFAAGNTPAKFVTLDQKADPAALSRYHYTDQGTRLVPAAWLAAIQKPNGSGKVMNAEDLRRYGFLVDNISAGADNPYGWPIGWTVSDPAENDGVSMAGFTCAMCHTGRLDYKGTAMVVEGGQPMIDIFPFVDTIVAAFVETAIDPVMRRKFVADAIAAGYPAERMERDFDKVLASLSHLRQSTPGTKTTMLPGGPGRVDAVQGIANRVFGTDLMMPANQRNGSAPVSYPYLWDIWRLSWLQYNGLTPNDPDFRNISEVLGTEAKTNLVNAEGQLNPEPLRWQTSVQIKNLRWMEATLRTLRAPVWQENVLGRIDRTKAQAGRALFTQNCAGCHGIKALPDGQWDVNVIPLEHVGTDPTQATNFAGYTYDLSKIGLSKTATAYQGLQAAGNAIRKQLYEDNNIQAFEREPETLLQAPCGYKARPLIGVWATPPFLHNGSVRTVFDLLSEKRPTKFRYGTREYDPVHLGYTEDTSANDAILDTSIAGNLNTGHWFTNDTKRRGRIGRALSNNEKYAVIEYLKSATYENYPTEARAKPASVACQDKQGWALKETRAP